MAERRGEDTSETLTDQAAVWLAALDAGTADPVAFEAWRNRDPRHALAFAEIADTWAELDRLRPMRREQPAAQPKVDRRMLIRGAVAATVVAAVSATAWPWIDEASAETGVGERRTVRLPSGVTVDMNTDTRIRWRRTGDGRTLWLDRGEIAVTIGNGAPLALIVDGRRTISTGSINARIEGATTAFTALSDRARIAGRNLASGATMIVEGAAITVPPRRAIDSERARAWQRGEVVFAGETLAFALADYNRYLARPIRLADPRLGAIRLGGRFATADPAPFLAALEAGFGLEVRDLGDGPIVIARQKTSPAK